MKALLIIAALLGACAPRALAPAAPAAELPVRHFLQAREPADAEMQALARGVLAVENGCLRIGGGVEQPVIVWPAESVLTQNGGETSVRNGRTGLVLRLGDRFEMAGGFVTELQPGALREAPPEGCPGPYWIAGSEWRLAQ